jgi:ribonuclease III
LPVLTGHLRFHKSLEVLETSINYKFQNRYLLQLALTHPSYKENFGTNPDHARNSLTNCGIRQPEYGDRKIHYMNTRKRGINTLINIMSRFGKEFETDSNITHNERLEFLGDAVVEFLTSIHLFHMFPDLEEGGLATYRAAIVQNQHLAVLARV